MGKIISFLAAAAVLLPIVIANTAIAQSSTDPKIGIRGGLGTDPSLGLAYGVGANYLFDLPQDHLELGVQLFGGSFEETTDQGTHTYNETTDLLVFGLIANYLINYNPRQSGLFYITGFGLSSISMEWEERSSTDPSLGTPLPGGGSMQAEEGSAGGTVLNLGLGTSFSGGVDLRAEIPVIVTFSAPGQASAVLPTLIATVGFRF